MRLSSNIVLIWFLIELFSCAGVHVASAQSLPDPQELVQELQAAQSSNGAKTKLTELAKSDPAVRAYLTTSLPPIIQLGPGSCHPVYRNGTTNIVDLDATWQSCPWHNAVELAGRLKIAEAVSALAPWIGMSDKAGIITGGGEAGLGAYPAARALSQIGDPAVPTLQHFLSKGNPIEHANALHALCLIDSSNAKSVLRQYLPRETSPGAQQMIRRALEKK